MPYGLLIHLVVCTSGVDSCNIFHPIWKINWWILYISWLHPLTNVMSLDSRGEQHIEQMFDVLKPVVDTTDVEQ